MGKTTTIYVCRECGRTSPKFMGRCPGCGAYGTMTEEIREDTPAVSSRSLSRIGTGSFAESKPRRLKDIDEMAEPRIATGISELSQVLGGGIVPGSVILIGGDPGIGKSTLLLQTAIHIAQDHTTLYVSGEESERQIKMRAARLIGSGDRIAEIPDKLLLMTETSLNHILHQVKETQPDFLIIDSIQTMQLDEIESTAGSVTQVRECAGKLREVAKMNNITVFMIGHVTKEGNIAGPRILEHIVDTVLYLEGDRFMSLRLLRSVKNRYGATSEVGVFEMLEEGLAEVKNPSELFLSERMVNPPVPRSLSRWKGPARCSSRSRVSPIRSDWGIRAGHRSAWISTVFS